MAINPNQLSIQSAPEEESEIQLDPSLERAYEQGIMTLGDARALSGEAISRRGKVFEFSPEAIAEDKEAGKPNIEIVTPDHKPRPGVRREAKLLPPRQPRTPRERLAADQPPESQRPPVWDETMALRVMSGGKANHR